MIEVYLIITGAVFFVWLYTLVRQTKQDFESDRAAAPRPVVPLNLAASDEAVLVAEGHGRIVYINSAARSWFGLDGGAPNLGLMAQRIQPSDTLHDLLAGPGHASFRLGQRQIEAVSHTIPGAEGQRMVIIMREMSASTLQAYTDFDPLRALAIFSDISLAISHGQDLDRTINIILHSLEESINFDSAEVTLWQTATRTLRSIGRIAVRTATGRLTPSEQGEENVYEVGEGYTGWIAMYRQPLLINNVSGRTDVHPKTFHGDFQSYVGVPLLGGDELVGTLELTHRERNIFSQRDVALLQAVSGQLAAAIQAARQLREQKDRLTELSGVQQIAQAISQFGEPAEMYSQLTQRIASLIDAELCGVLIYDAAEQVFYSQPPFYGVPDSLIRHYRVALTPDTELYTIWHHQPWWYTNDAQSELIRNIGFEQVVAAVEINSLALVPMVIGSRRTGMLMVANKRGSRGFTDDDARTLMSFASQSAVVTENARLYHDERRRTREFSGVQQITQAMGLLRSSSELYSEITQQIAGLFNVAMCGVLLYDAKDRVLVSQQPFYGLDDAEAVRFYQVPSPPDGPMAQLWQVRGTWFSNDLRRDPTAPEDLATLAAQVGIRQTVIATLIVGGSRLGIIQVANRLDDSEFTEDDEQLLSIFAGQAAILIDNARLYREMQHRTHEAEGLRAVTEIAAQASDDIEAIEAVLVAVANVFQVERVMIGQVNDTTGHLAVVPGYVWGASLNEAFEIDAYAPGFESSVLVSRRPFISNDLRGDHRVLPQYREMIQRFDLHSGIQVPLIIQDRSIGELTIGNRTNGEPFTPSDVQLLTGMATQIAAMLERLRLQKATDQDLHARIQELSALGRVSHELSQTLELDRVLDVVRQEVLRSTAASAASVVLLQDRSEWESPNEPSIERRFGEGRSLRELAPVERASVLRNDVLLIEDYASGDFEAQPARARSALAVPITYGDQAIGVLHLFSQEPRTFTSQSVEFAVALTDQATIAIANSRRYQEQLDANRALRVRAEQMGRIFELGEMFRQGSSLVELLEEVAHSVQETIGFNVVLISLLDERAEVMRRTAQAGLPLAVFEQLQQISPPLEQARGLMQSQYRVSNSYFLPAEGSGDLIEGLPIYQVLQERLGSGPRAWDPDDLLIIPMYGSAGRLLGLITVDDPQSGRRPEMNTVEALEIFANQAAFSIENYRLVERIQLEAEATRRERDRLAQLHLVASEIQRAPDVPARLQVVANGIHDAGWGHAVITLRDEHLEATAMIQAGYTQDEAMALSDEVQTGERWRTWINDLDFYELKLGAGYYLRYNHPWVAKNILNGRAPEPAAVPDDEWHPQDVLFMPLVGQDQKRIIGIIAMDSPLDGRAPTEATLQPFELFAAQAAAAIETSRLYQETVRAAEQEQRINEVMEAVSASISPEGVIQAVGRGLQQVVPFTRMSVALYNEGEGRFDVLRTEIALDTSVVVRIGDPMFSDGTATGLTYRETKARLYQLGREEAVRQNFADLRVWFGSGERSTMLVPMIAGGQPVGVLHLGSELENAFGFRENLDLIQRLSNLSAVALENARLLEQAQHRAIELDAQAQRLTLINRVAARLAGALDVQDIYQIALSELQQMLRAQFGGVAIYETDTIGTLVLDSHPGAQDQRVELNLAGNQLVEEMKSTLEPVLGEDVETDPRFAQTRDVLLSRGTRSLLLLPLIVARQAIGSVGLDFTERRVFSKTEIELAATITSQVAVALEKANLLTEAEHRAIELDVQAQRLETLNRMSVQLAQTLDSTAIYEIVLRETQRAINCQFSGLMLIEPDGEYARLVLSTHPMDDPLPMDVRVPLQGNPIAEYIMATRQPAIVEDIQTDPRFEALRDLEAARNTRAMMIIPLVMGDRVIGTLGLDSSMPRQFTAAETELAITAANQAAVAIENSRLFTETQQRAAELNAQAQRLTLINRVSARLAQTLDQDEIYQIVLVELCEALGVPLGGLVLFENEKTGKLVLSYPLEPTTPNLSLKLKGNRSIEIVRSTRRPLVSYEVLSDPVFEAAWPVLKIRGSRSLMIIPLLIGDKVIGTIGLDSLELRKFTDAETELAETIAAQGSLAIEKARLYNETLGLTIFNQAVVESIQQGIVVLDRDLHIRRINRFMSERYGWTKDAVDKPLFKYRSAYEAFLREPMALALGMGEPQVQFDVERRDEDGNLSIRNYYVYPMLEARQVTGLVLLLEDVTERARLELDLETRAVQMSALSEVSSQITATLDRTQVIDVILDALETVIPYDGVALWLRTAGREELSIVAARGYRDPDATGVDELVGLKVEIPYSPLFKEMAEKVRVINAGDIGAGDPRFPYGEMAIYKNWLGAPLINKGKVVGVIALEKREPNFYTPLHEQLALTFANQAAVALDNAELFQQTRERAQALNDQAQRLALLNRVSLALAQTLDLENIYEIALRETAIALGIEEGAAIQFDPESPLGIVVVEYPRGDVPPQQVFNLAESEITERLRSGLIPLVIDNTPDDPVAADLRRMLRRPDVTHSMLVPLVGGGDVIGLLRLDALNEEHEFPQSQIELAQTIASQAAIAVQNASLYEQASIRRAELEAVFESAQATAVTLDLEEVIKRVAVQMMTALNTDICTVSLWDDVNNRLEVHEQISAFAAMTGLDAPGTIYVLDDYPVREQVLRDRTLRMVRSDDLELNPNERQFMVRHQTANRMLIPLVVNEVSIGLVEVESANPNRYFRSETVRLARTLASQAAISIENARLQTETRRTVEELYIINEMSSELSSANTLDQLLVVVENRLPTLLNAEMIYMALSDPTTRTLSFPLAAQVRERNRPVSVPNRPLGKDEFSTVIQRQAPLLLAGENLAAVRRSLGIESMLPPGSAFVGVPLFAGEEVIGVLAAQDDTNPLAFSHNDQRILNTVGAQLGVAIQSKRLFQQTLQLAEELEQRVRDRTGELERERQQLSTLYLITTELATSLDVERLLERALEMVAQSVGATQGAILAVDPISDRLFFRARMGWPTASANGDEEQSIGGDEGMAGWAIQNRQSLIVNDVQRDPHWLRLSEADDLPGAAMAALIESNEDVLGVIMLYSATRDAFTSDHLRLVTAAANQVANAMNNAELYSLIRDQAERLGAMLRQEQVEANRSTAILDSVADGVMVTDPQGKVIVFNNTASSVLGLPLRSVIGRSSSDIAGLYGAGRTRWAESINRWMSDPTAHAPGEFLEERITLEDERVINVRVSPVSMGDQFLGTVSIFRDITREVEVDRLKSEFVATVSHELRTPMTSIKGYADLLLLGAAGDITEAQHRFLETIKQNADRLSTLVNDLLDISRIDQGRMELTFAPVDVEDVFHAVAVHLRTRSEEQRRPLSINVTLPEDQRLSVWGDYDKVTQIITNLADNAFNYTRAGGSITLKADQADEGGGTILSVADTGIGIPPQVQDRIFERFFRGDEVQEMVMDTPGTGLGLAIVRELVQVHEGEIWFDSEVGHGTTFYVKLPSTPRQPLE